ncbi:MAG: Rieske 2Fe-2S domain-containing protein [Sphingopyxis sp.]|nr:Rieske 2Fe-2S domain-containing protein [Sphingopyxis sp.]
MLQQVAEGGSHSQNRPHKRIEIPMPVEGEGGLFTQSWYAVAMASELGAGEVIGKQFLDGRIAIYRTDEGVARVVSAFCPHLGARLDKGAVVGDRIQCPFHRFEYNGEGRCVATGIGAAPPPTARLFNFPTVERFGFIWAFNGEEPLWQLPDFAFPDDELIFKTIDYGDVPADPYVLCCNTPDYHHYRTVHQIDWAHPDPDPRKDFRWTDHSFQFDLDGTHWDNLPMKFTFGIYSTSLFFQQGWLGDDWYGYMVPFTVTEPGNTKVYFVIATRKGDGSPEALAHSEALNDRFMDIERRFVDQDLPILDGIQFRQGTLTSKDLPLAMYLDLVRKQPRAHPSADHIR